MKIIIIIVIIALVVVIIKAQVSSVVEPEHSIRNIDNIEPLIGRLMNSQKDQAFVIITKHGTEDFIQFTGDEIGVQLDFPIITENQKKYECKFKSVVQKMGLITI